ncbi:hypothetical protein MPL3356_50012 [Mesorhizobium plurifarium]|uniref:Uncharacterized protein n=1 Tax=Mesorhizobium plurifarium TaxID=69974 RepID=A0A090E647_MESPL|nr:hypothetical protein MPL3356_50012 [Mesorhizobium plurifarium]
MSGAAKLEHPSSVAFGDTTRPFASSGRSKLEKPSSWLFVR